MSNNTTLELVESSTNWLLQFSLWPLRFVCPLLIIFCPIANWICIRIFQSRLYNRSSSKWYFIFIAIFDTIYVVVTAPLIFLLTFQIYILNWNVLLCKSIVFFNYFSCQISAGLLACLSIDRLIATSCLLVYRSRCTSNVSKYVCLLVIVMFSFLNCHYLIGYTIDANGHCNMRYYHWYEQNYSRLNVVYLLSYSIIPFTIITVCNLFIVISVYQSKSTMKKKYFHKRSVLFARTPSEPVTTHCEKTDSTLKPKEKLFVTVNKNEIINQILPSLKPRVSENFISDTGEVFIQLYETSSIHRPTLLHSVMSSSSSTYSQRICIQLQITISLIAISISFIFCTLPNCISTIMIQNYSHDEERRKFWQAMNYFSIVPLLITHSVNVIFYYLSSNMFRDLFKQNYLFRSR